ncbi:TonB-dependent receptor [Sphingomonas sp. LaA6.9]|uniref:TonB-dependent receptor n=1 Tax=Sphingomonas sp. LaA6.9 TaxID=2919914 RepID=UPI001F4F480C|nr:TonB-dependent receptor [Sphingomonas sp. LaA6.9]MCJ8159006.1 TonB-dependent receptor [Sphingomonas sp. LaA6.9]
MMSRKILSPKGVALLLPIAGLPAAAQAQAQAEPPAQVQPAEAAQEVQQTEAEGPSDGGLAEIVVTAQKRAENLQDVPIAVTALSADALSAKGVGSVIDLNSVVPGLSYTTQAAAASPRIRGVGTAIATGGNENAVSTYVDGVYYASAPASVLSLNNIAQITVLKGPQGTLFGRNATGGLIQITTRDPGQDFEGQAKLTYGNHDTYGGDLYLSGGLTTGLAADLAVHYLNQSDGFGTNLFNGKDVNKSRDFSVRSKWKAELGSDTTATVILDYTDSKSIIPAYRPVTGVLPITGVPFTGGKFDVNSNVQPHSKVEQYGGSLELRHDFGDVELVSITAYRHSDWDIRFDSDSLPQDLINADILQLDRQFSQELQLVSNGSGPFNWVLGAYYFNARGGFEPGVVAGPGLNFVSTIDTRQRTKSFAGFAQGTYRFTDQTSLTLGVRLTSEKKSIEGSGDFFVINPGIHVPQGPYEASDTVTKPTWRIALDHKLTDDVMIYGSYNRGFKSGGFDPASSGSAKSFKPEVLDAFEIGLKSEFFDRRVRLNGAAFYYDYRDIQLNTFQNGLLAIYNGDSAKIYGLDLDATAVPIDGLTLTAGVSLLHGRYGDFPITQTALLPNGGVTALPNISADGKRLQNVPDYQFNAGFDYKIPLDTGSISLAADFFHSGRWYSTPENRLNQKAYSLVNGSIAWFIDTDEKYSVRLWGRNLFNVAYADQLTTQIPITDFVTIGRGRTFGATLDIKF